MALETIVVPFSGTEPHRAVYNNSMLYPHLDAEQALMSISIEVEKSYWIFNT